MIGEIVSDRETYTLTTPFKALRMIQAHGRSYLEIFSRIRGTSQTEGTITSLISLFRQILQIEKIEELLELPEAPDDIDGTLDGIMCTLYAMPKIHKTWKGKPCPPSRPLVQGFSTIVADLNRWISKLLHPWLSFCDCSILEIQQAHDSVQNLEFTGNVSIIASDIASMYPSISTEDAVDGLLGLPSTIRSHFIEGKNNTAKFYLTQDPRNVILNEDGEGPERPGRHLPFKCTDNSDIPSTENVFTIAGWILDPEWHPIMAQLLSYALKAVVIKSATRGRL